jgi:hypothetical protein
VVFYEGGDPTAALHAWKKEKGLLKKFNDELDYHEDLRSTTHASKRYGFTENAVDATLPPVKDHSERLAGIVREVIDEYYDSK